MNHLLGKLLPLCAAGCLLANCATGRNQPVNTGPGSAATPALPANTTPNTVPNQPAATPATASTATKSGWWIRINSSLTSAQAITFQTGTNKRQREEWRVWRAGEAAEFDLPAAYAQVPRLYLRGSVTPIGKIADLCLMYKDRGVEHLNFDDDESETKSQTQLDYKCR